MVAVALIIFCQWIEKELSSKAGQEDDVLTQGNAIADTEVDRPPCRKECVRVRSRLLAPLSNLITGIVVELACAVCDRVGVGERGIASAVVGGTGTDHPVLFEAIAECKATGPVID